MTLTTEPTILDSRPLAPLPYLVERETYAKGVDGGADYDGDPIGKFAELPQAWDAALSSRGRVVIYLMRSGERGGELGSSIARFWDGTLTWVQEGIVQ